VEYFNFFVKYSQRYVRKNIDLVLATLALISCLLIGGLGIYLIERSNVSAYNPLTQRTTEKWTYVNSVYFVAATLSTIGYGDLAPSDWRGRLFVIFLLIVGIVIYAFAIASYSRRIIRTAERGIKAFDNERIDPNVELSAWKKVKLWLRKQRRDVITLTIMGFWLLIGAAIFNASETYIDGSKWGYGNALYFCIITFTTIGYGDMHPRTEFGRVFFIFYSFIGLGLASLLLSDFFKRMSRRIQIIQDRKSVVLRDMSVSYAQHSELMKVIHASLDAVEIHSAHLDKEPEFQEIINRLEQFTHLLQERMDQVT